MNLTTHITDIVNFIKWEDLSGIVLVGHSYGGYIVSGAAEQIGDKVSSIVFLDAFVPENGESLGAGASQPVKDAIAAALGRGEHALKPVPASVFRVNEKDRAWVDAKCTPQPIGTFTETIKLTGARDKIAKKSYIRAKGYPSVPFDAMLAKYQAQHGVEDVRNDGRPRRDGRSAAGADRTSCCRWPERASSSVQK